MDGVASLLITLTLISGLKFFSGAPAYQNDFDHILEFTCPSLQTISVISSIHSNKHEDRQWAFTCKDTFTFNPSCQWSGYVNGYDEEFRYNCPSQTLLSGVHSVHNNRHEDRRWRFYCCRDNTTCLSDCQWSPYVNCFDEEIHWSTPTLHYLASTESYHDNKKEDRRWKYLYCLKTQCSSAAKGFPAQQGEQK